VARPIPKIIIMDILDKCNQKIVWGGKDITQAVKNELRQDLQFKLLQGHKNQQDIAQFNQDNAPRMIDGIGEVVLSVDEDLFYAARLVFGEDCWSDKDFRRWVWKNYPEARVKNRSGKTRVGYTGNEVCVV